MGRWQPDARGRLQRAAMELFVEHGYDAVSVAEIVARAGLGRRSFYNHFADKREVMFAAADDFQAAVLSALTGADMLPAPLDAVVQAFAQVAEGTIAGHSDLARARQRLIDSSQELQERDLVKTAALDAAVARTLSERGIPARKASYIAQAAAMVFAAAVDDWAQHPDRDLTATIGTALNELRAAVDPPGR